MRKGVSEVVGIVLLIFMVVVVSGSFYYWYSAGQDEAQVKTEIFQADVFDQVVSRTSAIIDATYNTDREVNVNNFAEYKTRLCADEKPLVLDSSDIRLELYEGYGAETNIICAETGFEGGCNSNLTTLFGVLGGDSSTKGIYIVKSTDGTTWTTSGVSSAYEDYGKFNFTYLDLFVEGNNDTIDPENMLLMGSGRHSTTGNRKSVLTIINNKLEGSSYDITDLDENVTVYEDAAMLQDIPGGPFNLFRSGALVGTEDASPKHGILTRQFTVYDTPERLPGLGGGGRNFAGTKITAIQGILRGGAPQLLLGVTGSVDAGSVGFIDETQELSAGIELNYANPGTLCPYHVSSFAQCGITIDPVGCELSIDGVADMIHVPEFSTNNKIGDSTPVFIGINNLTNGTHKIPSIFYTGYSQGGPSTIVCLNLESIGVDPRFEIVEMKYHKESDQVLVLMKDQTHTNGIQMVKIRDEDGSYVVGGASPPVPLDLRPITFDTLGNSVYISGTNGTHATIFRINVTSEEITGGTRVYVNDTYPEIQKFLAYTPCTDRKPYCKSGCSKTLKKGDCTDLILSVEDSACDISGFSPETTFTVRLGIGKFFQHLEIFTKKTGTSDEINATEFN
jgi:flagellin-like protein